MRWKRVKYIAILVVSAILFSSGAAIDMHAETADTGDFRDSPIYQEYLKQTDVSILDDGCVVRGDILIDYLGTNPVLTVPDGIRGIEKPMSFYDIDTGQYIDRRWDGVTSLIVPDSVRWIAKNAFYGAELTQVSIPETTRIGQYAFRDCLGLADENGLVIVNHTLYSMEAPGYNGTVVIPEGVKEIEYHALSNEGYAISKLVLPGSLRRIQGLAIDIHRITELVISEGVEWIGDFSFEGVWIGKLTLPKSLKYIGDSAFSYSNINEGVEIPEGVEFIGENVFTYGKYPYKDFYLTIRGFSGSAAEAYAAQSEYITFIPVGESEAPVAGSYQKIGAFTLIGDRLVGYNDSELTGSTSEKKQIITVPEGTGVIGSYAFASGDSESGAFRELTKEIILPEGVTKIEADAFSSPCVIDVNLPETLVSIGERSFQDSKIGNLNIPASVERIGADAFRNCTSLQEVHVDGEVQIEDRAFKGCSALADENGFVIVDNILFDTEECTDKQAVIPEVERIAGAAFDKGSTLEYVYIPESIQKIGDNTFPEGFTILGKKNTAAQTYAKGKGIAFYELNDSTRFSSTAEIIRNGKEQPACDIDGDNQVTLLDAQLLLKNALDIDCGQAVNLQKLDADQDGEVNLSDAQKVLRVALKIE